MADNDALAAAKAEYKAAVALHEKRWRKHFGHAYGQMLHTAPAYIALLEAERQTQFARTLQAEREVERLNAIMYSPQASALAVALLNGAFDPYTLDEIAAMPARIKGLEAALNALVDDMRLADWSFVPSDIQHAVADALGDANDKTRRYRAMRTEMDAPADDAAENGR